MLKSNKGIDAYSRYAIIETVKNTTPNRKASTMNATITLKQKDHSDQMVAGYKDRSRDETIRLFKQAIDMYLGHACEINYSTLRASTANAEVVVEID